MDVAVLGCGPAGLLAAHAAKQEGAREVGVFSLRQKSMISGAQYVHEAIPGLTAASPDALIRYIKHGTRAGYATKVYGSPDAPCSWDHFESGEVHAWQMEKVYDALWDEWYDEIQDGRVDAGDIAILLDDYDLVISAIPKTQTCIRDHDFRWKNVWIADYNSLPYETDNVILYNGDPLDHWYRASRLFGHDSTESTDPMTGAKRGMKPLSNDCDCWKEITYVGRFGKWEKGVLVHHAYRDAIGACRALQQV